MRYLCACVVLCLALLSAAEADELLLHDGSRIRDTITAVHVGARPPLARSRIAAIRLSGDRDRIDAAWIERLLRLALERSRRGVRADGRIGVYVGRGVSAPSAIAVVRRLDAMKRAPRLLFEADVSKVGLQGLTTLVVPGGWAPSQLASLGAAGQRALRNFVFTGGHYLGICAGGYLVCNDVVWQGKRIPYPIRLVAGSASGPVPGRAAWPTAEAFELELAAGGKAKALYAGGSSFDVRRARVLATYPGGAAAAIRVDAGKGRLLLTGAHVEFDQRTDADLLAIGGWARGVRPGDASLLREFLDALTKR